MKQKNISLFVFLTAAIMLGFALKSWVVEPFTVPTGSMEPTIKTGKMVLVNKVFVRPFKNRDVVAFFFTDRKGERYVKRIVGVPGDSVYIVEGFYSMERKTPFTAVYPIPKKGETIFLDASNLPFYRRMIENYEKIPISLLTTGKMFVNYKEVNTYTFKQDYYFVQGDNTENSTDSRNWGLIPDDLVFGKWLVTLF